MRTLIVAPHPDDEVIGCGGLILRRKSEGASVGWLIMTEMKESEGWPQDAVNSKNLQIEAVREKLQIESNDMFSQGFSASMLDQVSKINLVERVSEVFTAFQPEEVFLPHPGDAHSDHRLTFEAAIACTKWFRYPGVKRVLTYETLSETDYGRDPTNMNFKPNLFVNIEGFLATKKEILNIYLGEVGNFPFPRSVQAIDALAKLRGSQAGYLAAEAFDLIYERI
ncbi:PIG-L family deacetylase [Paracoccaceae bacterium]|jgi:N-acetylglucosamine malate deacetylase 1|nr:PIG-L family deacetylase [Paracoccaceae bacterium]